MRPRAVSTYSLNALVRHVLCRRNCGLASLCHVGATEPWWRYAGPNAEPYCKRTHITGIVSVSFRVRKWGRYDAKEVIDVKPLITHSLPLDAALTAFELAYDREIAIEAQIIFKIKSNAKVYNPNFCGHWFARFIIGLPRLKDTHSE